MHILFCGAPYEISWNMSWFCVKALKKLGHKITLYDFRRESKIFGINRLSSIPYLRELGLRQTNERLLKIVKKVRPDVVLVLKGERIFPDTILQIGKDYSIPTILWFMDDPHLYHAISQHISYAYDFVFTSSSEAVKWHKELGVKNIQWLGFACDPTLHKKVELTLEEQKKYKGDIGFVGTIYKERANIFMQLKEFDLKIYGSECKNVPKSDYAGIYGGNGLYLEEMVKFYNARNIIINVHPAQQKHCGLKATMRVFETTGCGSFLITDNSPGIEELFNINDEIVCYEDIDDLKNKIKYYLKHDKEREQIALKGQERVYRDYTYEKRMEQILSVLK